MRHRTALITAGSIALVIFAGAVAVGANLGILNAADSRPFGKLSAAADVQTTGSEVVHVYATENMPAEPQQYVIRKAGTVSVTATKKSLRLADVTTRPGWTWSLSQTADSKLTVTFKSSTTTYTFLATLHRDGSIAARVDKPVTRVIMTASSGSGVAYPAAPAASVAPSATAPSGDDGHDGGEQDD
jgi:hypothetical protein